MREKTADFTHQLPDLNKDLVPLRDIFDGLEGDGSVGFGFPAASGVGLASGCGAGGAAAGAAADDPAPA